MHTKNTKFSDILDKFKLTKPVKEQVAEEGAQPYLSSQMVAMGEFMETGMFDEVIHQCISKTFDEWLRTDAQDVKKRELSYAKVHALSDFYAACMQISSKVDYYVINTKKREEDRG